MNHKDTKDRFINGCVTLPTETGKERETFELIQRWGADAIRDSDGTTLPEKLLNSGCQIYSTICLVRADQEWARAHPEQLAQKYLMSAPMTATANQVEIPLLDGFFQEKYVVDTQHDPYTWWEVIDRTTGEIVDSEDWHFLPGSGKVVITRSRKFHVYTVNFLVYQIWDSISMYNHLINNWTCPHIMSVDPYLPKAYEHLLAYFDQWLEEHPHTTVVRLTTLAYQFSLDSDEHGNDKYRDWLGYTDTLSPLALEDFARAKGYRLRPEDFVDQGYYNATYRVPSQQYLDWMEFIHKFVVKFGKELVDQIHRTGKRAAIFWGDHWIGVEPYSPHFQEMGIDINIGACEDGVALRRLADSPGKQVKEIRLYPYFFPDVFGPGGDPLAESLRNWVKIRRAFFRKPVDRIGYGGYLSVTLQFPEFVSHVETICQEFRTFLAKTQKTAPYTAPINVAVLNAWGSLRSWLNNTGPIQKFFVGRPDVTEIVGSNFLECLAGLPVNVQFLSFKEIEEQGIPADIDVIINNGTAGTSWSGGIYWHNERIVTTIREWIHNGGGFIGIEDPSAYEYQGRFFQLADVLGVQKEVGNSIQAVALTFQPLTEHFITADQHEPLDLDIQESFGYVTERHTQVVSAHNGHVLIATHEYGQGRAVYLASLPYSPDNSRLLHRTIFWCSQHEGELHRWFATNPRIDCAAFPETGYVIVANESSTAQQTTLYDGQGRPQELTLAAYECRWLPIA